MSWCKLGGFRENAAVYGDTLRDQALPGTASPASHIVALRRSRHPTSKMVWVTMSKQFPQRSIALSRETWEKIRERADAKKISQAQFIREAVEGYFHLAEGSGANLQRIAELCEFNQLVLDRIVRRDFSELHEAILNAVSDRLVTHHGK